MASQLLGIKTRFTNDLGSPLVGGQVYTYFAGTSTNQDTYSDAALTVPNTNPVILDDTGSADMFLKGSYRIRVFDKSGRFIEEQDNVTQAASQGDATEIGERIDAIQIDVAAQKLDTGITATAKFGGFERPLSERLSDSLFIGDLHAGGTDWTAAFVKAAALQNKTVIVPYLEGGYEVSGTFETHCRFIGRGSPTIKLTVNGGEDRGFWLQSKAVLANMTIERGVTAGAISGEYNNAIMIGRYSTTGEEFRNIIVKNVDLVGVNAGFGRTTIMNITGNTSDVYLEDIRVSGYVSYAAMIHWGGNFDPADPHGTPVTKSWHPRRIVINKLTHTSPLPDNGAGTIYISACHDITVNGLYADGIDTPISITSGDVGGLIAQGESVGRIAKGLHFTNTTLLNYVGRGVVIAGNSGTRAGSTWQMCNNNSQIKFDGLVITRGAKSDTGRSLNFRLVSGVTITGLLLNQSADAKQDNYLGAGYIQSCSGITIQGETNVPTPWEVLSSTKLTIDTDDTCSIASPDAASVGVIIMSNVITSTLVDAVSIGDTTVTIASSTADFLKGSTVTIGSQVYTMTKASQSSTGTVLLNVQPIRATAAAGASVSIEAICNDIELNGTADGFYYGMRGMASGGGRGKAIRINKHYSNSMQYDAYLQASRNVSFAKAIFSEGGQAANTETCNIRLNNACSGIDIEGATFEDNLTGSTLCRFNINISADSEAVSVRGCKFHKALTYAIRYYDPTGGKMRPSFSDNWFDTSVTPFSNYAGVAKTGTIGEMQIGHSDSAPTTGLWRSGDVVYNQAPVAGGSMGWVCVTGGIGGVWKTFGTVSA